MPGEDAPRRDHPDRRAPVAPADRGDPQVVLGGAEPHEHLGARIGLTSEEITRTKADRTCSSVAAASVLAKVERDGIMTDLAGAPGCAAYGWERNKGYAAGDHRAALGSLGPSVHHRRSWRIEQTHLSQPRSRH